MTPDDTLRTNSVPAPKTPEALARQRDGNAKGGRALRAQVGLPAKVVDGIEVTTLEGRQRLRRALVEALSRGQISTAYASTIRAVLADAAADAQHDQGELIDRLVKRLEELTAR